MNSMVSGRNEKTWNTAWGGVDLVNHILESEKEGVDIVELTGEQSGFSSD